MTCIQNRVANNPTGPSIPAVNPGDKFNISQVNNLRDAIKVEIIRWRKHAEYAGIGTPSALNPLISVNDRVNPDDLTTINDQLETFGGIEGYAGRETRRYPPSKDIAPIFTMLDDTFVDEGKQIRAQDYELLRQNYQQMRMDCICNTDCSANATGGSCPTNCGCNYSDKRLKMGIVYC